MEKLKSWLPGFGLKGWGITLLAASFYYLGQGIFDSGLNSILTGYNELYGWEITSIAFVVTIGGWIAVVAMSLFGAICKKKGAKFTSAVGLFGAAAFLVVVAGAGTNFTIFTAGVIGYLFFAVAFQTIGVGQFGANWFPHKAGIYMGIATFGMTIAAATINYIILGVFGRWGAATFMVGAAIVCALVAILMLVLAKNYPEEAGAYPDNDQTLTREQVAKELEEIEAYKSRSPWTLGQVLKRKETWLVGFGWSFPMMAAGGLFGQLAIALQEYGHDFMFGIMLLSSTWPLGIVGSYIVGIIDTRWGTKLASIIVVIGEIVGTMAVILLGEHKIGAALGVGLFLFCVAGVTNITVSMSVRVFGRHAFDNFWPVVATIFKILLAAGISIIAVIGATFGYRNVFWGVLVIAVLALLMMLGTKERCIEDDLPLKPINPTATTEEKVQS